MFHRQRQTTQEPVNILDIALSSDNKGSLFIAKNGTAPTMETSLQFMNHLYGCAELRKIMLGEEWRFYTLEKNSSLLKAAMNALLNSSQIGFELSSHRSNSA